MVWMFGEPLLPEDKKSYLTLNVSSEDDGEWELEILLNDTLLVPKERINRSSLTNGWKEYKFDLTKYAGTEIWFEIMHRTGEKNKSTAYWNNIKIVSE